MKPLSDSTRTAECIPSMDPEITVLQYVMFKHFNRLQSEINLHLLFLWVSTVPSENLFPSSTVTYLLYYLQRWHLN